MSTARAAMVIDAVGGDAAPPPRPDGSLDAVIFGANDDTRLLLRGLLRLQRHQVILEAATVDATREIPAGDRPRVLLFDVDAADDRWSEDLRAILEMHPDLRTLVLLPHDRSALREEAGRVGARAVIVRPFQVRDLVRLVDEAVYGAPDAPIAG